MRIYIPPSPQGYLVVDDREGYSSTDLFSVNRKYSACHSSSKVVYGVRLNTQDSAKIILIQFHPFPFSVFLYVWQELYLNKSSSLNTLSPGSLPESIGHNGHSPSEGHSLVWCPFPIFHLHVRLWRRLSLPPFWFACLILLFEKGPYCVVQFALVTTLTSSASAP